MNRAVLVGQMISPSAPQSVGGGIRLHTLWGRLAYQLGGKAGYEPDATHSLNDDNSPAVELAARILAQREAGPRVNPNLVVFLAAAANRLAELRAATRMYLAWKSIVGDQSKSTIGARSSEFEWRRHHCVAGASAPAIGVQILDGPSSR